MNIIAIYKKDGKLMKTTNLEKKEKKVGNLDVIWKMEFSGSLAEGEAILDKEIQNMSTTDSIKNDEPLKYYWYNNDNKQYFISIYENLPEYIRGDWNSITKEEYERAFC